MAKTRSTSRAAGTKSTKGAKSTTTRKRSTTKKKNTAPEYELPGGFWRQTTALLLLVVVVVLIYIWLMKGDSTAEFPRLADQGLFTAIGYAQFALPVILVWLAVKIFRSEYNKLPVIVWIAGVLMVGWIAGLAGVATIGQVSPGDGGVVGDWLNEMLSGVAADAAVLIMIYAFLIFVTALFLLQMNPATLFRAIGNIFHTKVKEETVPAKGRLAKAGAEKAADVADGEKELKINLGMGAEPEAKKEKLKPKKSLRDLMVHKPAPEEPVAAKPAVTTEPQALISVSDAEWKTPSLSFLSKKQTSADPGDCKQNAQIIQTTLADFGINVEMEGANVGPRITQYTMRPPAGVNLTKITSRDKELALNLAVEQIRIEAPIPGTRLVGVEVPNVKPASVGLRSILESKEWQNAKNPLSFVVGKDISGKGVVADLAKMPHLLIAGTTGSGKSVMTNMLIMSLLYRNSPSDLKLIMIDPKQVEMTQYEDIPHLLTPVITSVEKALSAMKWSVNEMERRYTLMAKEKVKKIDDYNAKVAASGQKVTVKDEDGNEQQHDGGKMPYIVIIVDEMADLMMQAGKDLEALIVRIAQKGRAAGIHLVLATQSPKVQVITGLIKSNVPSRITFKVTNFTESSVALGQSGAEKLLGMGDMIMLTTEMGGKPKRIQSAFAEDAEILAVTDFLREQRPPAYNDEVVAQPVQIKGMGPADGGAIGDLGRRYNPDDPVVRKAIEITLRNGKFSTASLQTWLGKGHGFVSGLAIWLEEIGVIGPANGHKPRDVLIQSMEEFDQLANGGGEA